MYQWWNLPNYYDWIAWYNEMLTLLYQERCKSLINEPEFQWPERRKTS